MSRAFPSSSRRWPSPTSSSASPACPSRRQRPRSTRTSTRPRRRARRRCAGGGCEALASRVVLHDQRRVHAGRDADASGVPTPGRRPPRGAARPPPVSDSERVGWCAATPRSVRCALTVRPHNASCVHAPEERETRVCTRHARLASGRYTRWRARAAPGEVASRLAVCRAEPVGVALAADAKRTVYAAKSKVCGARGVL